MFRVFDLEDRNKYVITHNSINEGNFNENIAKGKKELTRKICCLISLGLIIISIIILISCIKDIMNYNVDTSYHTSISALPRRHEIEFIKPTIRHIPVNYNKPITSISNENIIDKCVIHKYVNELSKLISDTNKLVDLTQQTITNSNSNKDNIKDVDRYDDTNKDTNSVNNKNSNKIDSIKEINNINVNNYSFTRISKKYNIIKKDDKNITVDEITNIESNVNKNDFTKLVNNIVSNDINKDSKVKQLLTNNNVNKDTNIGNGNKVATNKDIKFNEDNEEVEEQ